VNERVATIEAAAAAFENLAEAEGAGIPMYARLCRQIAADPELSSLLLEAPTGQRLPVLLLAAIHDLVLGDPTVPLAAWYPSVGGDADHDGNPESDSDLRAALVTTVTTHRADIVDRVRHRQVQTNEVNRCAAWRAALATVCHGDDRPLALVEVGASAGLNLGVDRYRIEFDGAGLDGPVGPAPSAVRLATTVRTGQWPELGDPLPPVVSRVGVDQRPLDATDAADARWLTACCWPEQQVRADRLRAALARTAADPPRLVAGDMVDDLAPLVGDSPDGAHTVVLSSWALAYIDRSRRAAFFDTLLAASHRVSARGGRLTLLTLEADHLLPWVAGPPVDDTAPAEVRHASLLAITGFDGGEVTARPMARCQAHLAWMDRLDGPTGSDASS
jgi:hypothetical protein